MDQFMNNHKISSLDICRYLIIFELIAILFSPALSNLFEIVLFAFCIVTKEVRTMILNSKGQPLFIGSLAFILMLAISTTWSVVTLTEALSSLWGWRKILLLPISLVLFQGAIWKERAIKGFVSFSIVFCVASYIMFLFDHPVHGWEAGVLVRNHATQGMIFAIAAFVMFTKLVIFPTRFEKFKTAILLIAVLALVINVSFITPGRSGYVVLLSLTAASVIGYAMAYKKINSAIILAAILIPTLILTSPKVHDGVSRGINEMENVDKIAEATSMGQRVKLWENTIEMIKEKPLLGVGLGGFKKAYSERMKDAPEWQRVILHDPHNQFLKIIAELGLIGFIFFIYMLASAAFQRSSSLEYKILGLGVLLAWCGTSMFSSHFSTFTEGRFIFIWLGVMLASHVPAKSN